MNEEIITKDKLAKLTDELKSLEGSVLLEVTQEKINLMRDTSADMAVYDNETMAKREFYRGVANGLAWLTKDIHAFIEQSERILQKRQK